MALSYLGYGQQKNCYNKLYKLETMLKSICYLFLVF